MLCTPLAELTSKHLVREAGAFTRMAAKAKTSEARHVLENLAARGNAMTEPRPRS